MGNDPLTQAVLALTAATSLLIAHLAQADIGTIKPVAETTKKETKTESPKAEIKKAESKTEAKKPEAKEVIDYAVVKTAVLDAVKKHGKEAVMAVIGDFGIANATELPEEKRGELLTALEALSAVEDDMA
jgi:hypothetical protein